MDTDLKLPVFFAELICASTALPGQLDVPRIARVGMPIQPVIHPDSPSLDPPLVVREVQVLTRVKHYYICNSGHRWFITFRNVYFRSEEEFYKHAVNEIARVNRAFGTLLPVACPIQVADVVYVASLEITELKPCWQKNNPISTSVEFAIVDDEKTYQAWEILIRDLIADQGLSLSRLLALEEKDPVVGSCMQLISEDTFVSYYKAFEVIRKKIGDENKLVKLNLASKSEISRFKDNSQVFRHANYTLNCKAMSKGEAKLFVLNLLRSYTSHRPT
jgi:hypothetical protein